MNWIPIEMQLPPLCEKVLLCFNDGNFSIGCLVSVDEELSFAGSDFNVSAKHSIVTHWCKLVRPIIDGGPLVEKVRAKLTTKPHYKDYYRLIWDQFQQFQGAACLENGMMKVAFMGETVELHREQHGMNMPIIKVSRRDGVTNGLIYMPKGGTTETKITSDALYDSFLEEAAEVISEYLACI